MRQNNYSSPFLFPSMLPNYENSSSVSTPSLSESDANSPPNPGVASSYGSSATVVGPRRTCSACQTLGRRCTDKCFSFAHSPEIESEEFTIVDRFFGGQAINFIRFLQEQANAVNELKQAKQLAAQLRSHPNCPGAQEVIVEKIISSFDKALSALTLPTSAVKTQPTGSSLQAPGAPPSCFKWIDVSDQGARFNGLGLEHVQLSGGATEDGPYDGFTWIKNYSRVVPGAKYPRHHFSCGKIFQGCEATKQVHRSDEDPAIFTVTYWKMHTCKDICFAPAILANQGRRAKIYRLLEQ